jgi:hypothetical protein
VGKAAGICALADPDRARIAGEGVDIDLVDHLVAAEDVLGVAFGHAAHPVQFVSGLPMTHLRAAIQGQPVATTTAR